MNEKEEEELLTEWEKEVIGLIKVIDGSCVYIKHKLNDIDAKLREITVRLKVLGEALE